ncbi:hypothetical protein D3C72_2046800 [compost metagenome]
MTAPFGKIAGRAAKAHQHLVLGPCFRPPQQQRHTVVLDVDRSGHDVVGGSEVDLRIRTTILVQHTEVLEVSIAIFQAGRERNNLEKRLQCVVEQWRGDECSYLPCGTFV